MEGEDRGVEEMEKAVNDKVDSKKLKPKKKLWLIVGLIVIILAVVGGGWYYLSAKDESETKEEAKTENTAATTSDSNSTSTQTSTSTTTQTTTDETVGWKTYENTKYYYSFKHPSNITLNSFTGQGDDTTITADAEIVNVYENGITGYVLQISDLSTNLSLTNYIANNWKDKTRTDAVIAGTSGYKVVVASVDYYYVEKNSKKVQIAVSNTQSIASKIYSTFQFTK